MDGALTAHCKSAQPYPKRSAATGSQGLPGQAGKLRVGAAGVQPGWGGVVPARGAEPELQPCPRQRPETAGGTRLSAEPRAHRGRRDALTSLPPPRSQGSACRRPHCHRTARPRCRAAPRARPPAARPTRPSRSAGHLSLRASQPPAGNCGRARRAGAPGKCSPGLCSPEGRGQWGGASGAGRVQTRLLGAQTGIPGCRLSVPGSHAPEMGAISPGELSGQEAGKTKH